MVLPILLLPIMSLISVQPILTTRSLERMIDYYVVFVPKQNFQSHALDNYLTRYEDNASGKNDVEQNANFLYLCNHDKIKRNVTFSAEGVL